MELDGQIRREKKPILDQHERVRREEECLDLETASHTARASRYSALHLKRLKTDDFSPFAAYDVHLASFRAQGSLGEVNEKPNGSLLNW